MSAITLNNVTYKYKKAMNNAISNISCTFEEGNVYAIVGPSGSALSAGRTGSPYRGRSYF